MHAIYGSVLEGYFLYIFVGYEPMKEKIKTKESKKSIVGTCLLWKPKTHCNLIIIALIASQL